MKLRYIYIFFLLLIVGGLSVHCSNDEEQHQLNFQKNTDTARTLLDSIRYGNTPSYTTLKSDAFYQRFTIVHISDIHLSDWTADDTNERPTNLQEAVAFTNLPDLQVQALVATGDFIHNNEKTNHQKASEYMRAFTQCFFASNNTVPSFLCTGNHDSNMLTDNESYYLSKQDMHNILFARTNYPQQQPQGENYFYADLPDKEGNTFRIISLDNADQEGFDYNTLHYVSFTQKQIDWLIQTALQEGMTDKHHVIILTHHPLQAYSSKGETYMCSGIHLYGEKMIPDIVNAFIKKQTLNQSYQTCISPWKSIHVNADFTGKKGQFVCYLGGHAHTSAHFEVTCNDASPAKQIMFLANTLSPGLQNNSFSFFNRKANTQSSNSFSIYTIDTQEQKIYITYFGAKSTDSPTIESISYR